MKTVTPTLKHLTLIVSFSLTAHLASAQTIVWGGGGGSGNLNWSSAANWTNGVPPASGSTVAFYQTGTNNASPGILGISNNVVDTNMTIGTLVYDHTNCYHTT